MERSDVKKRCEVYLENKTFIFITEVINNQKKWRNGFVISVHDDFIVFRDRIIPHDFPILFESILNIGPSNKENKND